MKAPATLVADKTYDAEAFVGVLQARKIVQPVAINRTLSKLGMGCKTAVPGGWYEFFAGFAILTRLPP